MSGNLPGHEAKKPKRRPLKRLETAVAHGRVRAFDRALADCVECSNAGNWQQRALGLIMAGPEEEKGSDFMDKLMACPRPPLPSAQENFLGMAVLDRQQEWTVPHLIKAGFKIKPAQVNQQKPLSRLAYYVVMDEVGGYRPLLAEVFGRPVFQGHIEDFILKLIPNTHGDSFLSSSSASMLSRVFESLSESRKILAAQGMSKAMGKAILINGDRIDESNFPWHDGYSILRQAGLFDLQAIMDGIGDADGSKSINARQFFNALEARTVSNDLQVGTPRAQDEAKAKAKAPAGLRF